MFSFSLQIQQVVYNNNIENSKTIQGMIELNHVAMEHSMVQ